jgi:imidazole glycerol-phosphate synthase subunit HisH
LKKIGIIDYGLGNLRSIQKAFEYNNIVAIISSDINILKECDKLVLPGVGAYSECKNKLDKYFGIDLLTLLNDKPVLGICVGMQLLFSYSLEFKKTNGLKLIDGFVDKLETKELPVPHAGWNQISIIQNYPLFRGIKNKSFFYFTHSYKCNIHNEINTIATVEYDNVFSCSVNQGNIYGVQFHPEKSGEVGLKVLNNFYEYC